MQGLSSEEGLLRTEERSVLCLVSRGERAEGDGPAGG